MRISLTQGKQEGATPTASPASGGRLAGLASFAIPAALVTVFLLLLINLRDSAEATAANVAGWLPVGYAAAAGMVASVNPCGFFLLPSYVSYHLGTEEAGFYETPVVNRAARALLLGGVATIGFIVLFAAVGVIIASGGRWLVTAFPYAGAAIGAIMTAVGLWLLVTHRTLGISSAGRVMVTPRRNLRNVFLFGIGYAVGSLSCTLPIFLVVVGTSLATQGLWASFGQFIGYSLGMGAILVAVTIGAALFRGTVANLLKAVIPYVHQMSALFMIGAGAYLLYYWLFYSEFFF